MSLCRQIQIWVTVLLLVMMAAVSKISLDGVRNLAADQLLYSTRNIADLSALALKTQLSDQAKLESKINWIFDNGQFERITLLRLDGTIVYQRDAAPDTYRIPSMITRYASIHTPVVKVRVFKQEDQFGTLEIKLHPGPFSAGLWKTFKLLMLLFLFLLTAKIISSFFILRVLLKTLNRIKTQAEAISINECLINKDIPKTPELKEVTLAMNTMVEKVHHIFNQQLEDIRYFQELEFIDAVTGLSNRKFLVKQLSRFLDSDTEKAHGHFFLIGLRGMEKNNISSGHPNIQNFFKQLAGILTHSADTVANAVIARLSQQEFGIILPDCDAKKATAVARTAVDALLALIDGRTDLGDLIEVSGGLAAYTYKDSSSSVLSKTDYALSAAKNNPSGTIEIFRGENDQTIMGKYQWQTMLHCALRDQRFFLLSQPVISDQGELHREIYINLTDPDGKRYKAGYFMPMAISIGLASRIDKYVLERAAKHLERAPEKILAVNVTDVFCRDRLAVVWLRHFLETNQSLQGKLFFEIHDNNLIQYPDICFDLAKMLKQMGFGMGIDQFSLNDSSLKLLKKISPFYIKIEKEYFQDITSCLGNTEVALNSLLSLTDSLNIKLIVTKIEDATLHQALLSKKIKYFQGLAIAPITPLE